MNSDFFATPTALISSDTGGSSNDMFCIANDLDFDLNLNFLSENHTLFNFPLDITNTTTDLFVQTVEDAEVCSINNISLSSSSTIATTISELIDSSINFSDLLQTDLSQFALDYPDQNSESLGSSSSMVPSISVTSPDDHVAATLYSVQLDQLDMDDDMSQFSTACESPASSMASLSTVSDEKSSGRGRKSKINQVIAGRVNKKESNKAAATRYRTKKQREREELFIECDAYAKKNTVLKGKIDDLQSEISFIKSLLVEVLLRKAKK
jgi:hypothetical protein